MSGYKHSRLETSKTKPLPNEIEVAEIAINMEDGIPYTKKSDGTVIPIGGASVIVQNSISLTEDFTLSSSQGGVSTSFTIEDGVTLTIEDGAMLSVV